MPKPRKGTEEVFYDTFAQFPLEEQAIALRIMTEMHRQLLKVKKPWLKPEEKPEEKPDQQGSLLDEGNNVHDQ